MTTKLHYGKLGGNVAYHGFQSFKENEVTPEECHSIGVETAKQMWGAEYEIVVATHLDKHHHLHNHFCQGVNEYFQKNPTNCTPYLLFFKCY